MTYRLVIVECGSKQYVLMKKDNVINTDRLLLTVKYY